MTSTTPLPAVRRLAGLLTALAVTAVLLTTPGTGAVAADAGAGEPPAGSAVTTDRVTPGVVRRLDIASGTGIAGRDLVRDDRGTLWLAWYEAASTQRRLVVCRIPAGEWTCTPTWASQPGAGPYEPRLLARPGGGVDLLTMQDNTMGVGAAVSPMSLWRVPFSAAGAAGTFVQTTMPDGALLKDVARAADGSVHALVQPTFGGTLRLATWSGSAVFPTLETLPAAPVNVGRAAISPYGTAGNVLVALDTYGSVSEPVRWITREAGTWTSWATIAGTASNLGVTLGRPAPAAAPVLVAGRGNGDYSPVIAKFKGSRQAGFTKLAGNGDANACPTDSHTLRADASKRLVDAYETCGKITVGNLPSGGKGAFVRFATGGTGSGDAAVASAPRGFGYVLWAEYGVGTTINLKLAEVLLPANLVARTGRATAGKVTLRVPKGCAPPARFTSKVSAKGLNGWRVTSTKLLVDGAAATKGVVDAHRFKAGSSHTLRGVATVAKGGRTSTVSVRAAFVSCPTS